MSKHNVTVFKPYPFEVGQKINISGGPRKGDWEVTGITERKVKLKCPISKKEFEWDMFCFHTEDLANVTWPAE